MARVNVEDDIESKPQWRRLVRLVGNDDQALGLLVRFWRTALKHWGEGEFVPSEAIHVGEFQPVVDSGWAVPKDGGFYALGSEERFAWYRQRQLASRLGGQARSNAPRDAEGRFIKPNDEPAETQPETTRAQPTSSPLTPSPSPIQKKRESAPILKSEIKTAIEEWGKTLTWAGSKKKPKDDEVEIVRLIQRLNSLERALDVLRGFRFEPSDEAYNAKDNCYLARLKKPEVLDRLEHLGAKNQDQTQDRKYFNGEAHA